MQTGTKLNNTNSRIINAKKFYKMKTNTIKTLIFIVLSILSAACSKPEIIQRSIIISTNAEEDSLTNAEAREDSIQMVNCLTWNAAIENRVVALVETPPVISEIDEDAADDPAIWVNTEAPEKSLVIGTQKKSGLYVYNLSGEQIQFVAAGKINNVDLRDNFNYQGKNVVLVAGSNRETNTVDLFTLNKETKTLSKAFMQIPSQVDEVYGLCMYKNDKTKQFYVLVNGKKGMVEQWLVSGDSQPAYQLVRNFMLPNQPEGMVADDENDILYLGVEEVGIFKTNAAPDSTKNQLYPVANSDSSNPNIKYDIEGLALYKTPNKNYLVASIQGNFSYAIWEAPKNLEDRATYISNFVIWEKKKSGIDGVEETDGLEIVNANLGEDYPQGLLVVQDGFNFEGDTLSNQNFKYISMKEVMKFIYK